jgi:hypothetical protein
VRASEQSGVAFLGAGRARWRVGLLVLALQIAAVLPLLVLSASAYGQDPAPEATAPDAVSGPGTLPADAAGTAAPQADPAPKPAEPAAPTAPAGKTPVPPTQPPAGGTTAPTSTVPPGAPVSVAPNLLALALPPASVTDPPDHAVAQDTGGRVDYVQSPEPPAAAIGEAVQIEAQAAPPPPIVSTPVGQPEPRPQQPAHEPKTSAAAAEVAAAALARPSPLVPEVTPEASLVVTAWRAPSGPATTASHASKPSAGAAGARSVRGPLGPAPDVPRTPSGSVCAGSSSCGTAFPAMLPLSAALGCLCALLLERLVAALAAWRPHSFVSLRERPG